MSITNYLDFDLLIEPSGATPATYHVRVVNSPAGQASAEFVLPFSEQDLEIFLLRIGRSRRRDVRKKDSPEMAQAREFGQRLFSTVFQGEIAACLHRSLDKANQQPDQGLRLRLNLTRTPDLLDLPWEYLYDATHKRFLCHSTNTPLVRYLDLPQPVAPLPVQLPLNVLVMIASPRDQATLDVEGEWRKVRESLTDLEQRGLIKVTRLPKATLAELQRHLRRERFHIFHFVGHGGFDPQSQEGVLLLEDEAGLSRAVTGNMLGTFLHDHPSLRLALLNACEGARTARNDPFAGVAQHLLRQGIPAVIAMQFEISDGAAITLAQEFYASLADGYPVDAALAEGRKAIWGQGNDTEWGTPVLYQRAQDGRLFDIALLKADTPTKPVPSVTTTPTLPPPPTDPKRKSDTGRSSRSWLWAAVAVAMILLAIGQIPKLTTLIATFAQTPQATGLSTSLTSSDAQTTVVVAPTITEVSATPTASPTLSTTEQVASVAASEVISEEIPTATVSPTTTPDFVATKAAEATQQAIDVAATLTAVPTATETTTATPTKRPTATPTPSPVPTATATPNVSASETAQAAEMATGVAATLTALPTDTPIPATATPTPNQEATQTAQAMQQAIAMAATLTAMPTETPIPLPTPTKTPIPTRTKTPTVTPTQSPVPPPTATTDLPATETAQAAQMATAVAATLTAIPTATPIPATATPTANHEATATAQAARVATNIAATLTALPTQTPTRTETPIPTKQPTVTPLPTSTPTPAAGDTFTLPKFGMTFVYVPAGEFTMGSSDADPQANSDEKPQHKVSTDAYWLGQTEITNARFRLFVEGDGYSNPAYWTDAGWRWRNDNSVSQPGCWNDATLNGDNQPVVCVSWYEAMAYSQWLTQKTGLEVRLPTEAEWEKAARGLDGNIFPWGNDFDGNRVNYCDKSCTEDWADKSVDDGFARTAPVGSFPTGASPYNALDMAGNVWEWNSTLYKEYPYKVDDGRENGEAEGGRLVRGGAWLYHPFNVRGALRSRLGPVTRYDLIGFRVVLASPGS